MEKPSLQERVGQRGTGENAVPYEIAEVTAAPAETADESENVCYTTATVTYTLTSGRKVIRNYSINMTKNYELIKKLSQDEEYQKAAYPLLAADADTFVNVRYRQSRSRGDQSLKNLTAEERNEVLSAISSGVFCHDPGADEGGDACRADPLYHRER